MTDLSNEGISLPLFERYSQDKLSFSDLNLIPNVNLILILFFNELKKVSVYFVNENLEVFSLSDHQKMFDHLTSSIYFLQPLFKANVVKKPKEPLKRDTEEVQNNNNK